ncbi:hypothetical protein PoB_002647100 [Plakobranchus ocellatus]|uniref:Uncharacterized protein n=1 Tax=Plakobranchus ocellatus TaxID=259542 RepID=A0AAV3ZLH8_9GAST|nr:hypothetical protein PoB_002647100 [Plakobranchus ocellatus]
MSFSSKDGGKHQSITSTSYRWLRHFQPGHDVQPDWVKSDLVSARAARYHTMSLRPGRLPWGWVGKRLTLASMMEAELNERGRKLQFNVF